jgi:hypothetical protein
MGEDDTVQHQPMPSQYADLLDTLEDDIPDFPITYDSLRSAGVYTPSENVNFGSVPVPGAQNSFGGMGVASNLYYNTAGAAPSTITAPNFAVKNMSNLQHSMYGVPAQPQTQTMLPVQPSPYNPFTAHHSQPAIPVQPPNVSGFVPPTHFAVAPPLSIVTKGTIGGPQNTSPTSPQYGKPVTVSDVMLDPFSKTSGTALPISSNNAPARSQMPVNVNASIASPLQRLSLGQSSLDAKVSPTANTLQSVSMQSGITLEKSLFLAAQDGRGLEIRGSFALRHSIMFLDLTFANKALQPMTDFSILFNTNSFSLCPAQPLKIESPLMPTQQVEVSLPLKLDGLAKPASPINSRFFNGLDFGH